MTTEQTANTKNTPSSSLPWLVAAGAMVVYLLTLNHWVTFGNLGQVVQLGHWTGQQPFYAPLYFLVTYPLGWLPGAWQPMALNLFAMICAVVTLFLLARSIMLLPHDRTREQRLREQSRHSLLSIRAAWLPPVLATLVLSFQQTFWENATSGTSAMFDLLLFAYVIRCLLEYRISERESWLTRFALVYGLAIPNDWAMIGFAPAFLVALVWIKGMGFFNSRFVARMIGCGAVGLLLYLLLPLLHSLSAMSDASFWQVLKANLVSQKSILFGFPRYLLLILGLTSLAPAAFLGVRWASSHGDSSAISIRITTLMFYVVHAIFLVGCTIVAFDTPFSPRNLGMGLSFLTFYYLGALSIGYYSGFFLLVFGTANPAPRMRSNPFQKYLNVLITSIIWLALVAVPAGLFYQNLSRIRANNYKPLTQYASLLAKSLPAKGAVVLSDDPQRLYLLTAMLHRNHTADQYILVDTRSLKLASYLEFLHQKHGSRWPYRAATNNATGLIDDVSLMKVMFDLSHSNEVYYLHPSFGYYFEEFYPIPHGPVVQLKSYTFKSINPPPLTPDEIAENEAAWKQAESEALSTLPDLIKRKSIPAIAAGNYYSCALNYWGVQLQKAGRVKDTTKYFDLAMGLNPDNVVAQVNRECNESLLAGKLSSAEVQKSLDWGKLNLQFGPYDEPNYCFEMGRVFARGKNYRQAAQQLDRTKTLAPGNLDARLLLGQLMILGRLPEQALALVKEIRAQPELLGLNPTNQLEVLRLEASAYFSQTNNPAAEQVFAAALTQRPGDPRLLALAAQLELAYGRKPEALAFADKLVKAAPAEPAALMAASQIQMSSGQHAEALATIEKALKIEPDYPPALLTKGALCIQLKTFDQAIPPLTRLLALQPDNHAALLNRAIANLQIGELDAARNDYDKLKLAYPAAFQVYYGLGEIAYRKKETRNAIENYKLYLKHAPPRSEERKVISARLKELGGEAD